MLRKMVKCSRVTQSVTIEFFPSPHPLFFHLNIHFPYRLLTPVPFLLCLPTIPRSRLLLHYGQAWATKLCSLTPGCSRKPAAPPSSSCQIPRVASTESKERKWLVISPHLPSPLSGQQTVQGKSRPDLMPKNHIFDHMCFFCRDQGSRSSTGLEKELSMW